MRPVVVWTGPVAFFQVPGATLPSAYEINLPCLGDRNPYCPTLAASYVGADGRRIPQILARAGAPPESEVGDIAFGAFSAGGSFMKRLLMSAEDRARTAVVHLADATWTSSWEDQRRRIPPVDEGFVLYAIDAARGPHLFIATASPHPNKTWATGIENLRRLRAEVEERTGERFVERPDFFGVDPKPDHVYQLGNVILAEFPEHPLGHGHTAIAGQIWEKIVRPWLASNRQPGAPPVPAPGPAPGPVPGNGASSSSNGMTKAVVGAVAFVVGLGSAVALARWQRWR